MTGGGPTVAKELSELEEQALSVFGMTAVEGIPNTEALGFLPKAPETTVAVNNVVCFGTEEILNVDSDGPGDELACQTSTPVDVAATVPSNLPASASAKSGGRRLTPEEMFAKMQESLRQRDERDAEERRLTRESIDRLTSAVIDLTAFLKNKSN